MGTAVGVGAVVGVSGTGVFEGTGVKVNGRGVWVNGSVNAGAGVNVTPGGGVFVGVRVGTFGTYKTSPA